MGRLFPSAVQIIEKDLDSLLTLFQFDPTYWTVLRTTNPIERLNKEFKRRTNAAAEFFPVASRQMRG